MQNNYGLRKIIKTNIERRKLYRKINNRTNNKNLRSSAFGLHPQATTENFTIKDEDYKYGIEALSNPKTPIHPNSSLSQITIIENCYSLFKWAILNKYQIPKPNIREIDKFLLVKLPQQHQRTCTTPKQRSFTTNPKKSQYFYKAFC